MKGFVGAKATIALYAVVFLAGAGIVIGIFQTGRNYERGKCEVAALQAALAAKETDLKASQEAAEAALAARAESEAAAEEDRKRISEYEDALKSRPDGACVLTDDDIRRVRGNTGGRPR